MTTTTLGTERADLLETLQTHRAFLHVVAETAQHAGHADILRESIDGQKTMG